MWTNFLTLFDDFLTFFDVALSAGPFCNLLTQAQTEVAMQFSEVALQHSLFCSADVIFTKSCAATSKQLHCSILEAALQESGAFLPLSCGFQASTSEHIPLVLYHCSAGVFLWFLAFSQKTREGCGCFWGLCGSSGGKFRENSGKIAGKFFPNREMLQILGFRAPAKANLPGTLGPHCRDLVPTFRAGYFLKSTVPAFSSFSDLGIIGR